MKSFISKSSIKYILAVAVFGSILSVVICFRNQNIIPDKSGETSKAFKFHPQSTDLTNISTELHQSTDLTNISTDRNVSLDKAANIFFRSLDTNKDGFISQLELDTSIGYASRQNLISRQLAVVNLDSLGGVKGHLSFNQFQNLLVNMSQYKQEDIMATFDKVTVDPLNQKLYYDDHNISRIIFKGYYKHKCGNESTLHYNYEKFKNWINKGANPESSIQCGEIVVYSDLPSKEIFQSSPANEKKKDDQVVVQSNKKNSVLSIATSVLRIIFGSLIMGAGILFTSLKIYGEKVWSFLSSIEIAGGKRVISNIEEAVSEFIKKNLNLKTLESTDPKMVQQILALFGVLVAVFGMVLINLPSYGKRQN